MPKIFSVPGSHRIELDDDNVAVIKFYQQQFNNGNRANLLNFEHIITATLNRCLIKKVIIECVLVDGPLEIIGLDNLEEIIFLNKPPEPKFLLKLPNSVKIVVQAAAYNDNNNNNNQKRTYEVMAQPLPQENPYKLPDNYTNAFLEGFKTMTGEQAIEVIVNFIIPGLPMTPEALEAFQKRQAYPYVRAFRQAMNSLMRNPEARMDILIALHHPQGFFKHVTILNRAHQKILGRNPENLINTTVMMAEMTNEDAKELQVNCADVLKVLSELHRVFSIDSKEDAFSLLHFLSTGINSIPVDAYYRIALRGLIQLKDPEARNAYLDTHDHALPFFEIKRMADNAHAYRLDFKKNLNSPLKMHQKNLANAAISYFYYHCALSLLGNQKIKAHYDYLFYYDHQDSYLKMTGNQPPRFSAADLQNQFRDLQGIMGRDLVNHLSRIDALSLPKEWKSAIYIYAGEAFLHKRQYLEAATFFRKAKVGSWPETIAHARRRLEDIVTLQTPGEQVTVAHTQAAILNQFALQQDQTRSETASEVRPPSPHP
jgi:hypothetical protein